MFDAALLEPRRALAPSEAARRRFDAGECGAVFLAGWMRALMIHFAVPAERLRPFVPDELDLDLRDGTAWVSLVAFEQVRLRPAVSGAAGRVLEALSAPLARHGFLNVRTYVRHAGEPGIFFLAECIPNLLAVAVGTRLYGLPYRFGRLAYDFDAEGARYEGRVSLGLRRAARMELAFGARWPEGARFAPSEPGSRTEFLMERYSAYTMRKGVARRFRIWHAPWPQTPCELRLETQNFARLAGPWWDDARFVEANVSTGVPDVEIGRPARV
ncbi:MAG: DUF2071 domain-containing protein [Planctomycetota bacterium]|nr:DUF2071 domain-containing protein [Planctomycetota bacterium]